jgi:2-haloacid dehalogenase
MMGRHDVPAGAERPMTERWATFDCYGTLIDWEGGLRRAFARLWPAADTDRLLRRYHAIEPLVQEGRALGYREVQRRTLLALAATEGLAVAAGDEFALADSLPDWPAFPEVPPALRALREQGWKLAILSNTDPELLAASLRHIDVPIDVRVTAAEAGSYKPAPGHWERFFALTAAPRTGHVHVGASLYHDIAPAHELGLKAVWINRHGESSPLPRAAELPDLTRLPVVLQRLVPA